MAIAMAASSPIADAADGVVRIDLSRLVGAAAHHRFLVDRSLHHADRPGLEHRQLPDHPHRPHLPDDHRTDRRPGRSGHDHGCRAGIPAGLLHGKGCVASRPEPALRSGPAPAVGQLPGAGVCLDPHPQPLGGLELEPAIDRPARSEHRLHEHGDVAGLLLHLAAFHDHPHLRRARAGPGLAARSGRRPRRAALALDIGRGASAGLAWRCGRLDLHVLADAWRLHHADPGRRGRLAIHRQRCLQQCRHREQRPVCRCVGNRSSPDHGRVPLDCPAPGSLRSTVIAGFWTRVALRAWAALILLFLFFPILLIFFYAFNTSSIESWPIPGLTTKWFGSTWNDPDVRAALLLSVQAGLAATAVALVLGSCAAFAIHRASFFGRDAVSLLFVLPLALPGIITGIALNAFFSFGGVTLSIWTVIAGHATFCMVVVYNNVLARLRRTQGSLIEAAMDLGANGFQVFRDVTLPLISTAVVAGAMLAFALSFDEVIVTTFTAGAQSTLPIWIFGQIRHGILLPEVNVVVSFVILVTIIPVVIAARLTGGGGTARVPAAR